MNICKGSMLLLLGMVCFIAANVNAEQMHMDEKGWSVSRNPAVDVNLKFVVTMHFDFKNMSTAGWSHLTKAIAPQSIGPGADAIKITFKADIPEGLNLMVIVKEGDCFYDTKEVAKPKDDQWQTIEIPFSQFTFSSWNKFKDENGKIDSQLLRQFQLGVAGKPASDTKTSGTLVLSSVEWIRQTPAQ